MTVDEQPPDPERPIIDPHHHLWEFFPAPGSIHAADRFLLPEFLAMIANSSHNFTHTVFVECRTMYRQDGPPELRQLGEIEFVNGVAAMSASGNYGHCRVAHRIVGSADPGLGAGIARVLERYISAAGERFRGLRFPTAFSEAGMFGMPCYPSLRHAMLNPQFRQAARVLAKMDLSLDIWCFHTQLAEVVDLATATPDLAIVLDHVGTPEYLGAYAGHEAEAHAEWKQKILELARRPNVLVKLGGLGMDLSKMIGDTGSQRSEALAAKWRETIETCIEAFTPQRCMFESNFPPDKASASYGATWNAFKIIARNYSEAEKDWLFRRTAAQTYRILLD
jgi:predicted TIM-barrel fold metal-dependent hydrolase